MRSFDERHMDQLMQGILAYLKEHAETDGSISDELVAATIGAGATLAVRRAQQLNIPTDEEYRLRTMKMFEAFFVIAVTEAANA